MNLYSKTRLFRFAGPSAVRVCDGLTIADLVSPDQTESTSAPQKTTAPQTPSGTLFASSDLSDSKWHFYGTGYIWIPGIHGTVGIRGFDASVHVTAGDIFSNFRGGFLAVFTPAYNRFSAPVDFIWMRLRTVERFRLYLIILCGPHST